MINDVGVINDLLSQGLITLIGDTVVLAGIIVVMLSLSLRLALLTFSVSADAADRLALRAARQGRVPENAQRASPRSSATWRRISRHARDPGVRAGRRLAGALRRVNIANRDANVSAVSLSFIFLPAVDFLGMLATGIVLWFGGLAVRRPR